MAMESTATRFQMRALEEGDFSKGFFELLGQLTSIDPAAISVEQFSSFVGDLNGNHQVLVIEDEESSLIVGSITVLIERKVIHNMGKVAHVEDVVVDNKIRGKGIGKRLLTEAIAVSKAAGECICICVCIYICMYMCVYVCAYVYLSACVCVCTCVHVCVSEGEVPSSLL